MKLMRPTQQPCQRIWHSVKALKGLKRYLVKVSLVAFFVGAFVPTLAFSGTNINARSSSSIYIDAYVNFVTASTFELFQMFFSLRALPAEDIGIGTNAVVKAIDSKLALGTAEGVSVAISGIEGEVVQISCNEGGVLSNGKDKLPISNVEVAAGQGNTGDYGEGIACGGSDTPVINHVLGKQKNNNKLYVGLRLKVSKNLTASRFTTSQLEGEPVSFEIKYI